MGKEFLEVVSLLTRMVCCTENEQFLLTEQVKSEFLYWYIVIVLRVNANFARKRLSILICGLQISSSVDCKLVVATGLEINVVVGH